MQFSMLSKRVTHAQAKKYLSYFGQSLEEFELSDQLALLISSYAREFIN